MCRCTYTRQTKGKEVISKVSSILGEIICITNGFSRPKL